MSMLNFDDTYVLLVNWYVLKLVLASVVVHVDRH